MSSYLGGHSECLALISNVSSYLGGINKNNYLMYNKLRMNYLEVCKR